MEKRMIVDLQGIIENVVDQYCYESFNMTDAEVELVSPFISKLMTVDLAFIRTVRGYGEVFYKNDEIMLDCQSKNMVHLIQEIKHLVYRDVTPLRRATT